MLQKRLYQPWGHLTEVLQRNQPASYDPDEGSLFDHLAAHPDETKSYTRAMHALSLIPARQLARRYDFSGHRHLLDVGGGSGVYAIEVVRRYPQLRATVFERPIACEVANEFIRQAGLQGRIQTEGGDFFREPLPADVDIALVSHVLHDYSPRENAQLLLRLSEALPAGGVLLVSEWLLDGDQRGPLAAALMSVNMLVDTSTGRNYSFGEIRALLEAAGFEGLKRRSLYGPASLIVARRSSRSHCSGQQG